MPVFLLCGDFALVCMTFLPSAFLHDTCVKEGTSRLYGRHCARVLLRVSGFAYPIPSYNNYSQGCSANVQLKNRKVRSLLPPALSLRRQKLVETVFLLE